MATRVVTGYGNLGIVVALTHLAAGDEIIVENDKRHAAVMGALKTLHPELLPEVTVRVDEARIKEERAKVPPSRDSQPSAPGAGQRTASLSDLLALAESRTRSGEPEPEG